MSNRAIDTFTTLMSKQGLSTHEIVVAGVYAFGWALKLDNKTEPRKLVGVQYRISPVTKLRDEPANPLSWADLRGKFLTATRNVMREAQQQSALDAVDLLAEGELGPLQRILAEPHVNIK